MSGLSAISNYGEDVRIRTLLLAGLSASVISATSCLSMLYDFFDPVQIQHQWEASGLIYVIALSAPSSWLGVALWLFQASILAIVWLKEATLARVIVTIFIGLRVCFKVVAQFQNFTPADSMLVEFLRSLLGWSHGMSSEMVNLNSGKYICWYLPKQEKIHRLNST
jgi:hypothetical protein